MYRDMCGLNPSSGDDRTTGFRSARIAPKPDQSLQWARATYLSAAGHYESGWHIGEKGDLSFIFKIPFNAEAQVVLPDANGSAVFVNGQNTLEGKQQGKDLILLLAAGHYQISYQPGKAYRKTYSTRTAIVQIVQNEQARAVLAEVFPMINMMDDSMLAAMGEATLRDMATTPYLTMTDEQLDQIDQALSAIAS
jgi:alpha-L-rhamnosidase